MFWVTAVGGVVGVSIRDLPQFQQKRLSSGFSLSQL
jgi:hypothetical protein